MAAGGTILLCAGGTGGHLFPAQALAEALTERGWSVHLATDARAARYAEGFAEDRVHTIDAATFASRNPVAILRSALTIWRGVRQSSALIVRTRPLVVIGFGGYPTLPPVFAATRRGVPTVIHEQNAVMGRANRMLAPRVSVIAGGFLKAEGTHADKIVETGNPVRQAVLEASALPYSAPGMEDRMRLLVFGGSQGARFLSDFVPEAVARLPEAIRARLHIVQQARPEDVERVRPRYAESGIEADVSPFFSDLPARMAESHLVISRSGASTVLELSVIGRPAILIPLPHAVDDDQSHNARVLVEAGGALVKAERDLELDSFSAELAGLLNNGERLAAMATAALSVAKLDATEQLADLAETIASEHATRQTSEGAHA